MPGAGCPSIRRATLGGVNDTARKGPTMSVTTRDLVLGAAALLVFPAAVNLTSVASSGDGRELDDPLFQRGGQRSASETAQK